jgi:hypothetical protein
VPDSLNAGRLAPNAVAGSELAANAGNGNKVAYYSLKGDDVDESSLGQVPNASSLNGRSASAFVANSTYRLGQGQERAGAVLGDGSKVLSQSCHPGDRLLSGGPASVNVNSRVLDDFAQSTSTWQARINDSALSGGDSFTVVVLCADQ